VIPGKPGWKGASVGAAPAPAPSPPPSVSRHEVRLRARGRRFGLRRGAPCGHRVGCRRSAGGRPVTPGRGVVCGPLAALGRRPATGRARRGEGRRLERTRPGKARACGRGAGGSASRRRAGGRPRRAAAATCPVAPVTGPRGPGDHPIVNDRGLRDRAAGNDRPTLVTHEGDQPETDRGNQPEQREGGAAHPLQQAVAQQARPLEASQPRLSTQRRHWFDHRPHGCEQ
jgi:hypothetical protein